jgi:hypothetical protein
MWTWSNALYANYLTEPRLFHLYNNCDVTFLTVFILTHPVNFPCGRKPVHSDKTHDFRQSVDWLFSHESVARIEPTNSEVKGAFSDDCATEAPIGNSSFLCLQGMMGSKVSYYWLCWKNFNKNCRNNRNISIFTSMSYHSVFTRPPFLFFQHNQQYDTLLPIIPCTHELKAGIAYCLYLITLNCSLQRFSKGSPRKKPEYPDKACGGLVRAK